MLKERKNILDILVVVLFFISLTGCLPTGKAPYYVEQYILDYDHPKIDLGKAIDTSVKFERFSVAQVYNNTRMNYRTNPFRIDAYNYSRWRVNPGDLIGDFLLRDMRGSNIIAVVMSYRNPEYTRFSVEGGVEEFLEVMEDGRPFAVLSLNLAVLDNKETEITKKIKLQKTYKTKEPLKDHSPESLAKGMSTSLARVSELFLKDFYSVLKGMDLDSQ
ncbi:MAG TPA: ABC-type transport auxiliary lipoprotein family protein [Syntrophorhabdaceae bacterium]|nr:ABC-type transport auxiliary lipoprotein family protein [Syntrophorhabdaceae bacterium]